MRSTGAAARPGGLGDWLPGAASARRALTGTLVATFENAGFELIEAPTVEYADTVERGLGAAAPGELFELFSGNLGSPLCAGGRYDALLGRFGLAQRAAR